MNRGWTIDSNSGHSSVTAQHVISYDESLSLLIISDEKNDIHHVNHDIDILSMKCFHSMGIKDSDTIQIQKQLVYTISLFQSKISLFHSN